MLSVCFLTCLGYRPDFITLNNQNTKEMMGFITLNTQKMIEPHSIAQNYSTAQCHDISDKSGKKEVKCFAVGTSVHDGNGKLAIVINYSVQAVGFSSMIDGVLYVFGIVHHTNYIASPLYLISLF